jgi:hypothetical protein
VRWAGEGSELWRVRVDLFAELRDPRRQIDRIAKTLADLLPGNDDKGRAGIGVDQGTGIAERPVVGLLFWVRADDVGAAAATAVETARRAAASADAGPDLYDVTVIPRSAVAMRDDPGYPPMPD